MKTSREQTIKVNFEFDSTQDLREIYEMINSACYAIHINALNTESKETEDRMEKLYIEMKSFANNFNILNF